MENKEIWKDCKGYEGLYQVSNLGRVWSVRSQRYLKPQRRGSHNSFYLCVDLVAKNGKRKSELIHRLVALMFIPNPDNLPQVNHLNENKEDNRAENLEWCSAKSNINYGTRNQKCREKNGKKVLCVETGIIYKSTHEAGEALGIYQQNIYKVCLGQRHTCGGFHWRYVGDEDVAD